ncbi:MAG: hypothetical protein R3A44_07355 [Caldilineaceae bacterium]
MLVVQNAQKSNNENFEKLRQWSHESYDEYQKRLVSRLIEASKTSYWELSSVVNSPSKWHLDVPSPKDLLKQIGKEIKPTGPILWEFIQIAILAQDKDFLTEVLFTFQGKFDAEYAENHKNKSKTHDEYMDYLEWVRLLDYKLGILCLDPELDIEYKLRIIDAIAEITNAKTLIGQLLSNATHASLSGNKIEDVNQIIECFYKNAAAHGYSSPEYLPDTATILQAYGYNGEAQQLINKALKLCRRFDPSRGFTGYEIIKQDFIHNIVVSYALSTEEEAPINRLLSTELLLTPTTRESLQARLNEDKSEESSGPYHDWKYKLKKWQEQIIFEFSPSSLRGGNDELRADVKLATDSINEALDNANSHRSKHTLRFLISNIDKVDENLRADFFDWLAYAACIADDADGLELLWYTIEMIPHYDRQYVINTIIYMMARTGNIARSIDIAKFYGDTPLDYIYDQRPSFPNLHKRRSIAEGTNAHLLTGTNLLSRDSLQSAMIATTELGRNSFYYVLELIALGLEKSYGRDIIWQIYEATSEIENWWKFENMQIDLEIPPRVC